jgi:DNA polymerase III psi subunit
MHNRHILCKETKSWAQLKESEDMGQNENNLLHNHVLADLFKETFLVDLNTPKQVNEQTPAPVLLEVIVFHHHESNSLPANQQTLLEAILNACKLNTTQVKIVGKAEINISPLSVLLENHQPKKIILFGVDPASIGLPIHFPVFQIQSYQQVQFLHAPSLPELDNDKQLKISLWQKLKQLFP